MSAVIEELLALKPYSTPKNDKDKLFLQAMHEAYKYHFKNCKGYRRFCERRHLNIESQFQSIEDIPYLPVQAFKHFSSELTSVSKKDIKTTLHSSATSGIPSTITIDAITAKRQVRALVSTISEVLGGERRPFLIIDVDPSQSKSMGIGARGAAVRGFLNLASKANYFMDEIDDTLQFKENEFIEALKTYEEKNIPVIVFGFTYVLFSSVLEVMSTEGKKFKLPKNSKVVHIGGWKKLEEKKVEKNEFNLLVSSVLGVKQADVVDFYGFTEQMGITYPDGTDRIKCTPIYSEVIVRDPVSFKPLPDGKEGLLEFLTPLPNSYPGIAILTDDIGIVEKRGINVDGWHGTQFKVTGRAKKAEVRGCGDIMGEKTIITEKQKSKSLENQNKVYLLKDDSMFFIPTNILSPILYEKLPHQDDIEAIAKEIRVNRNKLDSYTIDDLIILISKAAEKWLEDPNLISLKQQGLVFLSTWCSYRTLSETANQSLRGNRTVIDEFRVGSYGNKRLEKGVPRGVICHWLAGNVPLLGMLGVIQAILTKNANLIKVASTFSSVLPALLRTFENLEVKTFDNRIIKGNDILSTIAVIYFHKENTEASIQLSKCADVRFAWGGREAIESIINLERNIHTEDIVFGPKLSYMAIGKESLSTPRQVKKMARKAATDVSVFDQYACASPHTIFIEKGAKAITPKEFAAILSEEMEKALDRIPKAPADAGTVGKISSIRMRYELFDELWTSRGSEWTVLYDEKPGLAEPTYSRTIVVRSAKNILDTAKLATKDIQTIGISMSMDKRIQYGKVAAKLGCERLPEIGRMTHFDSPWDGLYVMDRLVRWVTLGGPF